MESLLEKNIYDFKGNVLICGTCLKNMFKDSFLELSSQYDCVVGLCLERDHINMAITKITGILSVGKVTRLTFVSVDKSPHCVQLHYIKNEIYRVMDKDKLPVIDNIIINNDGIHYISDNTIRLSKNLVELESVIKLINSEQ